MDQTRLEILFAVTAHVSTTRAIFRPFRGNDFVSNTGATLFCASEDYRNNEITLLTWKHYINSFSYFAFTNKVIVLRSAYY